jgi:predicted CoA-substrate-specific enzyme activase
MKVAGIDIGSSSAKAVILDGETVYHSTKPLEDRWQKEAQAILNACLSKANLRSKDLDFIVTTGLVDEDWEGADDYLSEVSCVANAARYLFPQARTAIDMGAEGCRVTKFDEMSLVLDYRTNQKCGSGTGLFLDVVADALEVSVQDIGEMSLSATKQIHMNSACAVFAESEVVSLIHQGESRADIISAVFDMIAAKTAALARAAKMEPDVVFSGGVARNVGMVNALSKALKTELFVPENPELVNALGAALEPTEMV